MTISFSLILKLCIYPTIDDDRSNHWLTRFQITFRLGLNHNYMANQKHHQQRQWPENWHAMPAQSTIKSTCRSIGRCWSFHRRSRGTGLATTVTLWKAWEREWIVLYFVIIGLIPESRCSIRSPINEIETLKTIVMWSPYHTGDQCPNLSFCSQCSPFSGHLQCTVKCRN